MVSIIVAIITSVIAPCVLFGLQQLRERKKQTVQKLETAIVDIKRDLLRLQILNLIQHDPKNRTAILELYDIYKSAPYFGNSYIKDVVQKWAKTKK